MAQSLEPDSVEISDIPVWMAEAKALVLRRPWLFLVLTAAYVGVSWLTRDMGMLSLPLGVLICSFFLVLLIAAARVSDDSERLTVFDAVALLQRTTLSLLLIAIISSLFVLAALALGSLLSPPSDPPAYTEGEMFLSLLWLAPAAVRFFFLFAAIAVSGMWLLMPLLIFHELSLLESAVIARKGEQRNRLVLLIVGYAPLFTFILMLLFSGLALVAGVLFVPYFAALQYVSYRHIFMRRKSNSPARVLVSVAETREA